MFKTTLFLTLVACASATTELNSETFEGKLHILRTHTHTHTCIHTYPFTHSHTHPPTLVVVTTERVRGTYFLTWVCTEGRKYLRVVGVSKLRTYIRQPSYLHTPCVNHHQHTHTHTQRPPHALVLRCADVMKRPHPHTQTALLARVRLSSSLRRGVATARRSSRRGTNLPRPLKGEFATRVSTLDYQC